MITSSRSYRSIMSPATVVFLSILAILDKGHATTTTTTTTSAPTGIEVACSTLSLGECVTPPNCYSCQPRTSMFPMVWGRVCIRKAEQATQTNHDYMALSGLLTALFLLVVCVVRCKDHKESNGPTLPI